MTRLKRLRGGAATADRYSLDALALDINQFQFGGNGYLAAGGSGITTTYGNNAAEPIGNSYKGYLESAYKTNGVVFACVLARLLLFSDVRFQFQRMIPRPGDLFGNTDLSILETPWPGATTGDLLARMEQSASLAGNAYVYRDTTRNRLKVLRPDWVSIIVGSMNPDPNAPADPHSLESEMLGYIYQPGGYGSKAEAIFLMPGEVAHYAPIPDPDAQYRGMSWLTPVLAEVQGDKQATRHKLKFFELGATPNLAVKYPKEITPQQLGEYVALMQQEHMGVDNAYKTLHIGGGADPMVIGANMQQIDFKVTQGAGETRIAAAAGVPPIVVGLSEGLEASTYSNYGQARRKFADGWARPAWRSAAGALGQIVPAPGGARLWYDASDVSFLQEDEKDAADIVAVQAAAIRQLVDAGYDPASAVAAVQAGDLSQLQHSGLYSVQLQAAGSTPAA